MILNSFFLRLRHTGPGGNDYAWDDNGPGLETDRNFFSNGKYSISKKVVGFNLSDLISRLSCHIVVCFIFDVRFSHISFLKCFYFLFVISLFRIVFFLFFFSL